MTKSTVIIGPNAHVREWVNEMAHLCKPDRVYWCDGSEQEKEELTREAVEKGILIRLDQKKLPGCYYHRSNPNDVARVEQCTYICSENKEDAGPTNNWANPAEMHQKLNHLCDGGMKGRTMYVVPYLMGPKGSPMTRIGIELTDSIYVVLNMRIMTRMGVVAYEELGERDVSHFNRGLHCMLDVNPERRHIAHFPKENMIISVGSAYGGNVLLGKKCLALRIGSYLGSKEGWLAEHMLILCVVSPTGEKTYVAAAFPSACGKTNFAMLVPPASLKGWKVLTLGDDIAWMKPGSDGCLYAINPEAGYFGVAPGTNSRTNPNAMKSISRDTIYTNVALTPDLDVWWEGKDGEPPKEALDWRGNRWTPDSKEKAAHPNSRFTAPMKNNPALAPEVDDPRGVPVSALIFGARRATTIPLIYQAFNWVHGVYIGATMGSETTAAAAGNVGEVRRDPMAMLPFCGYDMGKYFSHWLKLRKEITNPPRIFSVNWFRKDENGRFLWPGFSENMRVLKWIIDRSHGRATGNETPLGWMPDIESLDPQTIKDCSPEMLERAQSIDVGAWIKELELQDALFRKLSQTVPRELTLQRELLKSRLFTDQEEQGEPTEVLAETKS
jgi:phosphoenolpyruvate carboxykinase (GTP)